MKLHLNKHNITLAKAISEATGISLPCGGNGRCGGCAVKASGQLDSPSEAEKKLLASRPDGWRLACKAVCMGEVIVEIDDGQYAVLKTNDNNFGSIAPLSEGELGAAIDIGTTTIAATLIESATGKVIMAASDINPQISKGADVISRVDYAISGGAETLKNLITDKISSLLYRLTDKYIDTAVIVGNTVMLTLLTGGSVKDFAHAPFEVRDKFGRFIDSAALGCEKKCRRFYLFPCISAFIGADITSAILASGIMEYESAMLADIGTNGELVLNKNGELICASTAAGPAFEGAEITCGMTARTGAISKVKLKGSSFKMETVENKPPIGICASGLVSAVSEFIENGILDESGYLSDPIYLTNDIYITPGDIRKLQNAKAAIRAGIDVLSKGEPFEKLYLAGGIGNYLDINEGMKIGLLPELCKGRISVIGNAALNGGCMLLQNRNLLDVIKQITESAKTVDLASNPDFSRQYIENMLFKK